MSPAPTAAIHYATVPDDVEGWVTCPDRFVSVGDTVTILGDEVTFTVDAFTWTDDGPIASGRYNAEDERPTAYALFPNATRDTVIA